MAWIKLDDQIPRHHKIIRAGPRAAWLWVCCIAHAQSQLTDGFITRDALHVIGCTPEIAGGGRKHTRKSSPSSELKDLSMTIQRLVNAKLLEKVKDGYQVHDYLKHNASRAMVLQRRAEEVARKRGHRENTNEPARPQKRPRGHS